MGFRARCTIPVLAVLALSAADKSAVTEDPHYDSATVITLRMVVVEVREVAKGNPLAGVHLMTRDESSRAEAATMDVYLAPAAFLKDMEVAFQPRDRIDVAGSKVKVGNATVILAREVRHDTATLYLRDQRGEAIWKMLAKP